MGHLPIKRFNLFSRLYQRYLLEPAPVGDESQPTMATEVVATVDADDILKDMQSQGDSVDISSGAVVFLTVPANERWTLLRVRKGATANSVRVRAAVNPAAGGDSALQQPLIGPTTSAVDVDLSQPFRLEPGGSMRLDQGGGGDTGVDMTVFFLRESLDR